MELMMPLIGCNTATDRYPDAHGHAWFEQFEAQGDHTMRYFIEPVALAANHGVRLGYKHVVLVGLSGGGWTTTVSSAVVPAITLSVPIAGSVPKWPTKAYPSWVPDLPEAARSHAWPAHPACA
jgi:hypothetical protein